MGKKTDPLKRQSYVSLVFICERKTSGSRQFTDFQILMSWTPMFLLGHNTKTEISRADSQPANRHSEMPARDKGYKDRAV